MFSTLFAIFIALNVISTMIILAACVVSSSSSRRMEVAQELTLSRNKRIELEYAITTAAARAVASHA